MPNPPAITYRRLGFNGRLGNAVIQYAFLRTYARRFGLAYEVDPWWGQQHFEIDDPPIATSLPDKFDNFPGGDVFTQSTPPAGEEYVGFNATGYHQYHTSWYAADKEFIRSLFIPRASAMERLKGACSRLRNLGTNIIGIHLRRADFGSVIFYITPVDWYLKWLAAYWRQFRNPVLYVATQEPSLLAAFEKYNPVTALSLGIEFSSEPLPGYGYLAQDEGTADRAILDPWPEWQLLRMCDILLLGNSTYGFTAGWLSQHLREMWRSDLASQAFKLINPWNDQMQTRVHLRDHMGILGTSSEKSPYGRGEGASREDASCIFGQRGNGEGSASKSNED